MLRLHLAACDPPARLEELVHGRLGAGADVEGASGLPDRGEYRGDDVADVDEVACLLAVAVDGDALAAAKPVDEDRDDAAFELRQLPRPVDVCEPEGDMPRPVEAIPGRQVLLGRQLGRAVRRDWPPRVVLPRRTFALPVDRAARGAEDHLRAMGTRRLEHAQRAEHVHLGVELGLLDGRADIRLCCQVSHDLGPDSIEEGTERLTDVVLVQLRRRVQVLAAARREAVHDVHLVAAREQRIDDVRADETRSSGDHRPHGHILRTCS